MKDLWDSFKVQIHERLSSPLIGTFMISWLVWNHRLVTVLLSSMPVKERFEFIDSTLYPTSSAAWIHLIGGPLLCALAYIFLYPYPAKWVQGFWLKRQLELKEQRDRIEKATLLTQEESEELKSRLFKRVQEAENLSRNLREELDATRRALHEVANPESAVSKALNPNAKDNLEKFPDLKHTLQQATHPPRPAYEPSLGCRKVIEVLVEHNGDCDESFVLQAFDDAVIEAKHYIDEARRIGLISVGQSAAGARILNLSEIGRAYAVMNKMTSPRSKA